MEKQPKLRDTPRTIFDEWCDHFFVENRPEMPDSVFRLSYANFLKGMNDAFTIHALYVFMLGAEMGTLAATMFAKSVEMHYAERLASEEELSAEVHIYFGGFSGAGHFWMRAQASQSVSDAQAFAELLYEDSLAYAAVPHHKFDFAKG